MIEIAIADIQKYDMVQIFEQAFAGEKVVLVHQDKKADIMPSQSFTEIRHNKNVHLADLFEQLNEPLPKDYKFDREEANAR